MTRTAYQRKAAPSLLKSAEYWERLRDGEKEPGEEPDGGSCACCTAFHEGGDGSCGDCPIYIRTGKEQCDDTPFREARRVWQDGNRDAPAIQEEIDFLLGTRRLVLQGKIKPED